MTEQTTPVYQPLTEAELKELHASPLYGETVEGGKKHLAWAQNVLNNTPPEDPVFAKFTAEKAMTERFLDLRVRYGQVGWVYDDGRKGLFMPDKDYNFSAIMAGHRQDAAEAVEGVDLKGVKGE